MHSLKFLYSNSARVEARQSESSFHPRFRRKMTAQNRKVRFSCRNNFSTRKGFRRIQERSDYSRICFRTYTVYLRRI